MIPELAAAIRKAGLAVDWRELADIVWLMSARATYAAETVPAAGNAAQVPTSPEESDPSSAAPHIPSPGEMSPPQARMSSRELPNAPTAHAEASTGARIVTTWQVDAEAAADLSVVAPRRFALPRRREIERAIRPLMRRQRSSRRRELDVAATVDHYCDTGVLVPLLRRQEEPWLDVALVTDSGPSMTIWHDTCSAFGDLLERSGAFRHVGRWSIDASETGFALTTPTGLLHPTKELTDVAGRTLVLVLTDGISPRWVGSEVWEALRLWGKWTPTAILQLASGSAASLTTLGEGELVATARAAATPSARLQFDYPWWWVDEPDSDAAPTVEVVPLVPLTPGRMAAWARFVAGAVGAEIDAVVAGPRDAVPIGGLLPADDDAARDLLNTSLSPRSRRLGVLLSAVDLSLDLVRIITERLIPDADLSDLAHLIAIGALVFDEDRLAFAPVAQRYFHELVTAPDALDVWHAVAPYIEATGGRSPFSLLYGENTDSVADIPGATIAAELVERFGLARTAPTSGLREDSSAPEPLNSEQVRAKSGGGMRLDMDGPVSAMDCLVMDGRLVAVTRADNGTVRAWDLTIGRPFGPQPIGWNVADAGPVVCKHQADRPVALTAGPSGSVLSWALGSSRTEDLAGGESRFSTAPPRDWLITALAYGTIGNRPFVVSGHSDGALWAWDLTGSIPGGHFIGGSESALTSVVWARLHGRPVLLCADSRGVLWGRALQMEGDAPSAQINWTRNHGDVITCLAVTRLAGRPVFVTGAANAVEGWELESGDPVGSAFEGHSRPVTAVACIESDRGVVVVSGDTSGHLIAWDLESGAPLEFGLENHTGEVTSIVCVREDDGVVIVSAGADRVIRRHPTLDLGGRETGANPEIDFTPLKSGRPLVVSVTSTYSDGEEVIRWQYIDRGETVLEYGETTRSVRHLAKRLGGARSRAQFNELATEAVRALRRIIPTRLWPGLRDITRSRERPIVVSTDLTDVPWHLLPRSQRSARWDSCIGWRSPVTVVPQRWINPYEGDLFADDVVVVLPPPGSKTLSRARQEGRDLAMAYRVRPVFAADEIVPSPRGGPQVIHATVAAMGSFDLRQGPLVFLNVGSTAAFATGLLEGGARAVVAPLWAVNAKAAHRVAERFYAHLSRGSTTSHAMTQVRAELASEDSSLTKTVLAFQHFGDPSLRISFAPPSSSAAADYQMAAEPTPSRLAAPSRRSVFAAALVLDLDPNPAASQQVDHIVRWLADRNGASVDEDAVRVIRAPTERDIVTAALELLGTQSANQHQPLFLLVNGIVDSARGDGPVLVVNDAPDQSAVGLRDIVLRLARLHPGGVLAVAQATTVSRPPFRGTVLEASPHQPAPWMLVLWPAGHPVLSTITWAIEDLRRGAPVTGETLREALTTNPENRGRLNALESFARTLEESALDDAGHRVLADVRARTEQMAQEHDPEGVLGGVTVQGSELQRLVIIAGNEPDGVQFEPGPDVPSAASLELDSPA